MCTILGLTILNSLYRLTISDGENIDEYDLNKCVEAVCVSSQFFHLLGTPESKYLGVTLDSELNFNEHVEEKIKKAKAHLFLISKSIGKLWGPSPKLTKWAFTGMVRPMLSYGAIVYCKTLENAPKSQLDRLN